MSAMGTEYYGFREHPFQMTPDARFFFASTIHRRAYAHLMFGLAQREGFVVITGEVGAGKTTLIERLCGELSTLNFAIARVVTTRITENDLLSLVADAFGAPAEGNKAALLRGITAALHAGATGQRRHLLIVDEAQGLPESALEELRMLSNITNGEKALLQTVLLGQPQLRRTLARPSLDQLRQRILASYHLGSLSREETRDYVMHRMRAVGWDGHPSWQDGTLDLVHRFTDGIPRRVNRLCSRVLLGGALEQSAELTVPMIEATAMELEDDLGHAPEPVLNGTAIAPAPVAASADIIRELTERLDALDRRTKNHDALVSRILHLLADVSGQRTT